MAARIHGIVLAAGRSDRAGGPKALATLDGETFVSRAVRVLRAGGCNEVWVVIAPPHGSRIAAAIGDARAVENPEPERGMLSSLQIGLASALGSNPPPSAMVFSLVDHPSVGSKVVRRLVDRAESAHVLRPRYAGRPGHPVLLSAEVALELLAVDPTMTVKDALARVSPIDDLEIDDASIVQDADTPEEIRALGATLPHE